MRPYTCAYQAVRIVSFSENFAFVLNEWLPAINLLFLDYSSYGKGYFASQDMDLSNTYDYIPHHYVKYRNFI